MSEGGISMVEGLQALYGLTKMIPVTYLLYFNDYKDLE